MNNKYYVGKNAQNFEQYDDITISGVILKAEDGSQYNAGDQDGYVLPVNCKYATQEMADELFSMLGGKVYRGYRATNTTLDPMAELGDGVTVNGVYSVLAYRRVNFGPEHMSEIAAPGEGDLNHEYNYVSQTQKEIDKKAEEQHRQLQEFVNSFTKYLDDVKKQADAKAETWYQSDDPASKWSDEEKAEHNGDLWYNTSDSNFYIYNGKEWEKSPTTPPDYVFDQIDKKAEIYVTKPVPPYNVNDLWFGGDNEPIKVCVKSRGDGESFQDSDWEKKDYYINEADAIISVVQQYYSSDSPTTLSGGTWSDSQPTWTQGKYIWSRQYVTFGDGTRKYLPSETGVCITGNTGATGSPGSPGTNGTNGTSSYTHIRYSANANGSGFVTEPNANTKYIGIYTGPSQTAPESNTAYTWSKYMGDNGTNGTNGKDGNGIRSITYYYAATKDQTVPDASKVTSPTIPTMSETNKYLWQKEVIDFTDSSVADKTTVILLAVYGDKGKDGANGTNGTNGTSVSITSTSIEYKADANGTIAPSSGWSKTIPSVSNGQYLWTKTVVSYSDGTSTTAYSVAYKGTNGANGTNGTNGVGIDTIVAEYYVSDSDTQLIGGNWSTNIPSVQAGKYIWFRQKITYTDGNVEYAGQYCMSKTVGDIAQEKVDAQTQDDIFNKLTNNGQAQGIFKDDTGDIYINVQYLRGDTIDLNRLRLVGTNTQCGLMQGEGSAFGWTTIGIVMYGNGVDESGKAKPPYHIVTNAGIRSQSTKENSWEVSGSTGTMTGDIKATGDIAAGEKLYAGNQRAAQYEEATNLMTFGANGLRSYVAGDQVYLGERVVDHEAYVRGDTVTIDASKINQSVTPTVTSDERVKKDIVPLPEAYITMLDNMQPVLYRYDWEADDAPMHMGYTTQNVQSALSCAGMTEADMAAIREYENKDGEKRMALAYGELVALLHLKIKSLENEINMIKENLKYEN